MSIFTIDEGEESDQTDDEKLIVGSLNYWKKSE